MFPKNLVDLGRNLVGLAPSVVPPFNPQFVGCFQDYPQYRALSGLGTTVNSTSDCFKICYGANFRLAGLENDNQCCKCHL